MNLKSLYLRQFIQEIQYHNRNPKDIKALELLDDISTNPEIVIETNSLLYRCRIVADRKCIGKEKNFYGYNILLYLKHDICHLELFSIEM